MIPHPIEEKTAGSSARRHEAAWLSVGLLLALPSSAFIQKYGGPSGLAAYAAAIPAIVCIAAKTRDRWHPFLERRFHLVAWVGLAGLFAGYLLLHPLEDGRGQGKSSDRDEGLELAVTRAAHGMTPYYPRNSPAGPLSVLPGGILLAAPFVAIGSVGLQNWFWLAAFLFASARLMHDRGAALMMLIILLAVSPAVQYEYVSGGDLIANGIYVTLFLAFAVHVWRAARFNLKRALLSSGLLALGLASRANFLLLLPLFGAVVWQQAGLRKAIAASGITGLACVAIILPFYLNDPSGFTPLMSRDKLAGANAALPWADKAIIGATLLLSIASAVRILTRHERRPMASFFRCCTVVTLFPMLAIITLQSLNHGAPDFEIMHDRFGLMFVFFLIPGWVEKLFPKVVPDDLPQCVESAA